MAWIDRQPVWFLWPDFTNVFIGSQSLQGFEALGAVIGHQEGVKRLLQVLMRLVIGLLDGGFLSCPVQALDVAMGPGGIGGREPVCNRMCVADTCQDRFEGLLVLFPAGARDPGSGQHGMDAIGHGHDQMTQALGGDRFRGAWMPRRIGALRGAVDSHA
jgi:hypothetical protein